MGAGLQLRGAESARFRVNVYFQRGASGCRFPYRSERDNEHQKSLGYRRPSRTLPRSRAVVPVTGPTGSGKPTTLAAMIDKINRTRHEHIMSVEDPYRVPAHPQAVHRQPARGKPGHQELRPGSEARVEAGPRRDTRWRKARDLETIALAVTAAETGHLVFGDSRISGCPPDRRQGHRRLPASPAATRSARSSPTPCRASSPRHESPPTTARGGSWPLTCDSLRRGSGTSSGRGNHQTALGYADRRQVRDADHGRGARNPRRGRISRAEAEKRSSNPDELLRLAGSLAAANGGRTAYGGR